MILHLALVLIFILMVASVPFLHMGLYRYLSGRLSKDMGNKPEDESSNSDIPEITGHSYRLNPASPKKNPTDQG